MSRVTREIAWIRQARKEFEGFPPGAQRIMLYALTVAAEGGKADIAKPRKGLGSGVFEIALARRGEAYRVVYALQIHEAIWVVLPFRRNPSRASRRPGGRLKLYASA